MGRFSEELRKGVEAREAELRATLSGLDVAGLVAWCKEAIESETKMQGQMNKLIDPRTMILRSYTQEDCDTVVRAVRKSHAWREALRKVVKERRLRNEPIPTAWSEYLFDFYLGIEKGPDGRGKRDVSLRDNAICRCIWYIQRFTEYKPSRSEKQQEEPCGISIVAKAMSEKPGYDGVKLIWMNRDELYRMSE